MPGAVEGSLWDSRLHGKVVPVYWPGELALGMRPRENSFEFTYLGRLLQGSCLWELVEEQVFKSVALSSYLARSTKNSTVCVSFTENKHL